MIEVKKQDIIFEDNMDYDTTKRTKAEELENIKFNRIMRLRNRKFGFAYGFLAMNMMNLFLTCIDKEYRQTAFPIVIGFFALISVVVTQFIFDKKIKDGMDDLFDTGKSVTTYYQADRKIRSWRDIIERIESTSTMIDFKLDKQGNLSINTFWVDKENKAHNEIFDVPKEMVEYMDSPNLIIKLMSPVDEKNYIRVQLPFLPFEFSTSSLARTGRIGIHTERREYHETI